MCPALSRTMAAGLDDIRWIQSPINEALMKAHVADEVSGPLGLISCLSVETTLQSGCCSPYAALNVSPLTMIAQAMGAFACSLGPMAFTGSLLASATVTRCYGFFSSSARTQALFAVSFLSTTLSTEGRRSPGAGADCDHPAWQSCRAVPCRRSSSAAAPCRTRRRDASLKEREAR